MSEQNITSRNFLLGIISGVAVIAIIGFVGVSVLYFNDDTDATNAVIANTNFSDSNPASSPAPADLVPSAKVAIEVTKDDHIRGDFEAPVTIIEYSDFQCPYCSRFHDTMNQVRQAYPDKVRWVYKHFPLDSIHPYARKAAEASECAADQGEFWEYTDELYANQSSISLDKLVVFAKDIGLNTGTFEACLSSGKYTSKVESNYQEGLSKGVRGTPGTFINGQKLPGAVPFSEMKSIIDSL